MELGAAYKIIAKNQSVMLIEFALDLHLNKECHQEEAVQEEVVEEGEEGDSAVTLTVQAITRIIPTKHLVVTVTTTAMEWAVEFLSGSYLH